MGKIGPGQARARERTAGREGCSSFLPFESHPSAADPGIAESEGKSGRRPGPNLPIARSSPPGRGSGGRPGQPVKGEPLRDSWPGRSVTKCGYGNADIKKAGSAGRFYLLEFVFGCVYNFTTFAA
ncbi:hypothetical protein B4135_1331 [Caldibacillus debilis]|uniref:Uncharacterized protein n=1 Tax=Caldibacillus debilis TaxID=301148 RepID=A0A150MCM0_9BACI|nr:hypothetical protein B4135_1331 [Caldibacillus debilis]